MTTDLSALQARCNAALQQSLGEFTSEFNDDAAEYLSTLFEASAYTLNGGGKRIRAALVYAAAEAIDAEAFDHPALDTVACAVEMIHAYSLVHDDLPAMDDDDLRRGQPTVHKLYDEATAVLVGDALQARAFELLAEEEHLDADIRVRLIQNLAAASGGRGMVGGQAIDVAAAEKVITLEHLQAMHALKTGALIRASVEMGAITAGATVAQQQALTVFATHIGLAFQIFDDVLDASSDSQTLGKTAGADEARNKPTYVSLLGLDAARTRAHRLSSEAQAALTAVDGGDSLLRQLSRYIVSRTH